jgi:preprotein translocase subunit SecF
MKSRRLISGSGILNRLTIRNLCDKKVISTPSTKASSSNQGTPPPISTSIVQQSHQVSQSQSKISTNQKKSSLTAQEKERIASIGFVSPKEAEEMEKKIIINRVHGFTGLFLSLVLVGTGCAMLLN